MERLKIFRICILLLSVFVAACSQESSQPLRIGTNVWPGYEPLYLAREKGFLQADMVHLVEYSNSSQVIRSFRNGLIDAAALTLDEVMLLLESGEDLSIMLVMDISHGGDVIIGRKSLTQLVDIKGKKVGVEGNALGAYMITRALEKAGLQRSDINVVQMGVDRHEHAFLNKQVDAVVTFEPVSSRLLAAGGKQLFDSTQIPGEIVDVLVVRNSYLKKYSNNIYHLLDGWYRALGYYRDQPREAAASLGRRMKLGVDDTLSAYEGLILPDRNACEKLLTGKRELKASADRMAALMLEQGLLAKQVDVSKLFTYSDLFKR